jgi:hypothetical protein
MDQAHVHPAHLSVARHCPRSRRARHGHSLKPMPRRCVTKGDPERAQADLQSRPGITHRSAAEREREVWQRVLAQRRLQPAPALPRADLSLEPRRRRAPCSGPDDAADQEPVGPASGAVSSRVSASNSPRRPSSARWPSTRTAAARRSAALRPTPPGTDVAAWMVRMVRTRGRTSQRGTRRRDVCFGKADRSVDVLQTHHQAG